MAAAKENLEAVDAAPMAEDGCSRMCDDGWGWITHRRRVIGRRSTTCRLEDADLQAQAEPLRRPGTPISMAACRAVMARQRGPGCGSGAGLADAFKLRSQYLSERSFAHNLDQVLAASSRPTPSSPSPRPTASHERYLQSHARRPQIYPLLMRHLIGAGTSREAVAGRRYGGIFVELLQCPPWPSSEKNGYLGAPLKLVRRFWHAAIPQSGPPRESKLVSKEPGALHDSQFAVRRPG